ncbi:HEAT repeat domain-containing protein [Oscillospiraceae bacterium 38-13]
MNLQPLYDVKERLEQAAVAGAGLLEEDFRLRRAAENLKPLASASPVFGKISKGLDTLLSAPAAERPGLLLDLLALVDAVAYTQGATGLEGELTPLPTGRGKYLELSYGQLHPLLEALTTTGGGRMEIIQSAWEHHPEMFQDYRVLPAVVKGLGDGYGEIGDLNVSILKQCGPAVLPLLKEGFDPAGNRAMARRVEVAAAMEDAGPWLREILPAAKKDVRAAVLTALGGDPDNGPLLLELVQTERGGCRDAVLQSLALQEGEAVRAFWETELAKRSGSVKFLNSSQTEWSAEVVSVGLRRRLEDFFQRTPTREECDETRRWYNAIGRKDSPAMLDFWRWTEEHTEAIDGIQGEQDFLPFFGVRLDECLQEVMRHTGPGPLRDYCLGLWERRPQRPCCLFTSFQAALLSLPAAEVYERYAPYIQTELPREDTEHKKTLHIVLLRALGDVWWNPQRGGYVLYGGQNTAGPLDPRWLERLTHAVWKDVPRRGGAAPVVYWENAEEFDLTLMRLVNPADEEARKVLVPYLRNRMRLKGCAYTYSHWLFQLRGSPLGVLGKALAKNPGANRTGTVWTLMHEAAEVLPTAEVIALLNEILAEGAFHKQALPHLQKVIPWTIQQLRAGKPFPSSAEWS